MMSGFRPILCLMVAFFMAFPATSWSAESLNIYSSRKEQLIKPLLDKFTKTTGIKINLTTGKSGVLLRKLEMEGTNSPADVLITSDAGNLARARSDGLLQSVESRKLNQLVPEHLRDLDGYWYGLTMRARPIFYNPKKVQPKELSTYEQLADSQWRGRICIRSSNNIYNQSLVASMIASDGGEAVLNWGRGLVKNFARTPQGGDRDQIKAVAVGICDIAIANSYYYAAMLNSNDASEKEAARKVALFWPNQNGRGTHINVSGGAVIKSSKNTKNAIALFEFMLDESSQNWYAHVNGEYPVNRKAIISPLLLNWGDFRSDKLNLTELGKYNSDAVRIMDRAGWK